MISHEDIDTIALKVYRARLDHDSGEGAAERQSTEDNDDGKKQLRRSECYRHIVIETLVQAGLYERKVNLPPRNQKKEPTA